MDSLQWQEQYKFTANGVAASGANLGLSACQIQRRYFFQDYTQVNLTHVHCADIMSQMFRWGQTVTVVLSVSLILLLLLLLLLLLWFRTQGTQIYELLCSTNKVNNVINLVEC
jgi:hypothetical protein